MASTVRHSNEFLFCCLLSARGSFHQELGDATVSESKNRSAGGSSGAERASKVTVNMNIYCNGCGVMVI